MIYGYTVENTKTTGLIHLFLILGGLETTFIFYLRPFLSDVTIPTGCAISEFSTFPLGNAEIHLVI